MMTKVALEQDGYGNVMCIIELTYYSNVDDV